MLHIPRARSKTETQALQGAFGASMTKHENGSFTSTERALFANNLKQGVLVCSCLTWSHSGGCHTPSHQQGICTAAQLQREDCCTVVRCLVKTFHDLFLPRLPRHVHAQTCRKCTLTLLLYSVFRGCHALPIAAAQPAEMSSSHSF